MSSVNLLRDRADSTSSMMVDDNISRWKSQVNKGEVMRIFDVGYVRICDVLFSTCVARV